MASRQPREQPPRDDSGRHAKLRLARVVRERCSITYEVEQGTGLLAFRMAPTDDGTGEPTWLVELTWSRSPDMHVSASAPTRTQAVEQVGRLWRDRERVSSLPPIDWKAVLQLLARVNAM